MDEISMVGSSTLKNVHNRLVEIFEVESPFAGRTVLFVGDLNQLKPTLPSLGMNIYSRNSTLEGTIVQSDSTLFGMGHLEYIRLQFKFGLNLVLVYNSPKTTKTQTIAALKNLAGKVTEFHHPTLFMGDFNMNVGSMDEERWTQGFESTGLKLAVERGKPFTDNSTQLDLVYANIAISSLYYESIFSDHKPVITIIRSIQ